MDKTIDMNMVSEKILDMKRLAEELKGVGNQIPALDRNLVRLSASIKMLELNICDIVGLYD